MYEKIKNLKLKTSCSAYPYGFITNYNKEKDQYMISCLDIDTINISKFKLISNGNEIEQLECDQIKIYPIDETIQFSLFELHHFKFLDFNLFCIISSSGLHIFIDDQFTKPIYTFSTKKIQDLLGSLNFKEFTFNGISCLDSLLFLGTSTGVVLVFEINIIEKEIVNSIQRSIDFNFRELLKQHHYSITFINSTTDLVKDLNNQFVKVHRLSICDAVGAISIWHLDDNRLKFIYLFSGFNNYHCVSTKFYEDLLIASYSSGHIRLFSLIDKCLLCEISAHARPTTSMNICTETGSLITTSEDTFVRIWQLKPDLDNFIKQKYCYSIKNCLLVNGLFIDKNSKFFSVVAYDENEAFVFKKI